MKRKFEENIERKITRFIDITLVIFRVDYMIFPCFNKKSCSKKKHAYKVDAGCESTLSDYNDFTVRL